MKKRFLIVLLLAFISSKETYNITDVSSQECDAKTGNGHFNVYFQPNLNITERSYFNLTLKLYQGANELEVLCSRTHDVKNVIGNIHSVKGIYLRSLMVLPSKKETLQ